MHPVVESMKLAIQAGLEEASLWVEQRWKRRTLAWAGLALGAVTLLAVNLLATSGLRGWKADLTQEGLFTTSDGTRKALAAIDEPIDVRVYFSKKLGDAAPNFAKGFERLRALLDQYRDMSGGKLRVSYIDPEPFSEAEDRAVASGLRGIRLNQEGEQGYFGLVAANTTDNEANIPFFAAERDRFIEYDVTKLIYSLANPKKKVIGLISSLPIDGGMMPPMGMMARQPQQIPPQMIMEQIREVFEVKTIDKDATEIPADVGVLMLVEPDPSPALSYAIDQYVLKGGKVLAFVDANSEMAKLLGPMMSHLGQRSPDFEKLLKAWGVNADVSKVATDISFARRVQFGGARGQQGVVTDYVAWMTLDKRAIDQRDVLSGGVEKLNLATAAQLTPVEGATTTLTPILQTTDQSMLVGTEKVAGTPDAVTLLRGYKPEGKRLTLAARLSGEAKSAFPDGEPKPVKKGDAKDDKTEDKPAEAVKDSKAADKSSEPAKPARPHIASGKINVTVIGDTDLLTDQFWVDVREFLGQQIAVPNAQNSAFVMAALENLSGSDALISLRGRGISDRPFEHVNALRRDAERRFRDKEQSLTAKLKEVTEQLSKLEKTSEGAEVVLSEKDKQTIDKFRGEMLSTRKELRDVKLALRQDIDSLDGWLKFLNIAAIPLLIGVGGIGWALRRRRGAANA
jgi:ABC-type uncharacterized transport system involved in gliding motility auxiliary subunit